MSEFIVLVFWVQIFSVSFIAVTSQSRVLCFYLLKFYLTSLSHTYHIDVPTCGATPSSPATVPRLPRPISTLSRVASTFSNPLSMCSDDVDAMSVDVYRRR